MRDCIEHLAEYLTESLVAHHSVGLQLGGMNKARAEDFFDLRKSFGVQGYMDEQEAEKQIVAHIRECLK